MIAAIYSRKSDKQDGPDDELSVTRQIDAARRLAVERGWQIDETHVISDNAVSGAEFERRPGLVRLLAVLKRPPFDALLVTDKDRLGREQFESAYVLKKFLQANVHVFEVAHGGREVRLDTPQDKLMVSIAAFAAEVERDQARARTHATLLDRVRKGRSAGGCVFGYASVTTAEGHVKRTIIPVEADTVEHAFLLAAEGHGVKAIARQLNDEGRAAPRKGPRARAAGWSPSTLRAVLHNTVYRGTITWNRTRKRDAWGQRRPTRRDAGDVIRVEAPELRIIAEDLWQRAHERLSASRALYHASSRPPGGRPPSGSPGRYLLSGLSTCAKCGGGMFVHKRGGHKVYWGCANRHLRGKAVCANNLEVRLEDVDAAVLAAVERDLLNIAVLETSLAKAMDMLRPRGDADDAGELGRLRGEVGRLDVEVQRLAAAIASGGQLEALLAALQDREQRRTRLRDQIHAVERERAASSRQDTPEGILDRLREKIADLRETLQQETPHARAALQALLAGRIVFEPGLDGYTFSAEGTVSPIIVGVIGLDVQRVASPVRASTSTTRPSRPCCITTRLASHARRRDVSAGTSAPSSRTDWPG